MILQHALVTRGSHDEQMKGRLVSIELLICRIGSIRPEDPIPEHGVLTIVALWKPVVHIVGLDRVDIRDVHIKASVVQRGEDSADDDEEDSSEHVAGNQVDGEKVEVLADQELDGVDVHGIGVASTGRLLSVVVLVDVGVDEPEVQELVEAEVEEVVHHIEEDEGAGGVEEGELVDGLHNRGRVDHNLRRVEDEDDRGKSIERNKRQIE